MSGEFSVWIFFAAGFHFAEAQWQWVDGETAMRTAKALTERVAARTGIISRIIITDGGDNTCFEWKYGEGVTFPKLAEEKS
jgi:hypothetical protein